LEYRLLSAFQSLFQGVKYEHRKSQLGDYVASFLFEDMLALGHSKKLAERVTAGRAALNTSNVTVGKSARRGDGTFGEVVPGLPALTVAGFVIPRSRIAAVEIGVETKILAKAMIKQIDRVINDLCTQTVHFRNSNPDAICVALIGVNHAEQYISFEGSRKFATDGRKHKHPAEEALEAESRLMDSARGAFDEFVLLRFSATNFKPYAFRWVNEEETKVEYAASLARLCREYGVRA